MNLGTLTIRSAVKDFLWSKSQVSVAWFIKK